MQLFKTVAGLQCYLAKIQSQPSPSVDGHLDRTQLPPSVGLVPTMGALHQGHLSLIQQARQENQVVVVSIFVNPLQFGPNEDLSRYPRDLEQDRQCCEAAGVDVIFAPDVKELYAFSLKSESAHSSNSIPSKASASEPSLPGEPSSTESQTLNATAVIPPREMIAGLCGQARPGHFEGVATVVTKLLNLVQPDLAYFGQKDAQQVAVLRRVAADLNLPTTLVICPIVREDDGLAYSSRNQYLSAEQRSQAVVLYRSLKQAEQHFQKGQRDEATLIQAVTTELATVPDLEPEYVALVHPETMLPIQVVEDAGLLAIAARLGATRLIDNLILRNRKPILAIDGPAGAGKSTVARQVAETLDLMYLDTGAMYRAVTWLALDAGVDLQDEPAIAELVSQCKIQMVSEADRSEMDRSRADSKPESKSSESVERSAQTSPSAPVGNRIWINGKEVTQAIRSREVTDNVSAIAAQPFVRQILVQQQQQYGRQGGIVMEGRDIGTYVFPDAELKIFLTASVQERARRRQQDLKNQNQPPLDIETLAAAIQARDQKDSTRAVAPLRQASDAIELQTDGLTIAEVIDEIASLYRTRLTHGT